MTEKIAYCINKLTNEHGHYILHWTYFGVQVAGYLFTRFLWVWYPFILINSLARKLCIKKTSFFHSCYLVLLKFLILTGSVPGHLTPYLHATSIGLKQQQKNCIQQFNPKFAIPSFLYIHFIKNCNNKM